MAPTDLLDPTILVVEIGKIGKWVQAIGLFVVLWVVVQVINLIVNRKKRKAIYQIRDKVDVLEKKIDRLSKKKR
jgi:hypothetical protein